MAACSSAPSQSVQALPSLPPIRIDSDTLFRVREPAKCIHAEADVQRWQSSAAYSIFLLFVSRLSQAVVGKPTSADLSSSGKPSVSFTVPYASAGKSERAIHHRN